MKDKKSSKDKKPEAKKLSNPFSSGGGGTAFEQLVGASYLVSLLREEIPRGLPAGIIKSVRFQARQAGAILDDLLITSHDGQVSRHLALQLKHSLTFSSVDKTFQEVMDAAWKHYTSAEGWTFTPGFDRLGIGIGVINADISAHLLPLLEWARACLSAQEFLKKVGTSDFSSKIKQNYLQVFRTTLNTVAKRLLSHEEIWEILKHFVVLHFDLEYEGSRDATISWNHLLDLLPGRDPAQAVVLFEILTSQVGKLAPVAGALGGQQLFRIVTERIPLPSRPTLQADLKKLFHHTDRVLQTIRADLAGQLHLPRVQLTDKVWEALQQASVIFVVGDPGSGKSAILRGVAQRLANEGQVWLLRPQELDYPMLESYEQALGLQHGVEEVIQGLSATPQRCLLIDGLERALSLKHWDALNGLLGAIRHHNTTLRNQGIAEKHRWKILCTCRPQELEDILPSLPALFQEAQSTSIRRIGVDPLSDAEVQEAIDIFPHLQPLWNEVHLRPLLCLPLYLDILTRQPLFLRGNAATRRATEAWFAEEFWRGVIRRHTGAQTGLGTSLGREQVMLEVARQSLQTPQPGIPTTGLDSEALYGLISDQVLGERDAAVTFVHDVFADWALLKLLAQTKGQATDTISTYQEAYALERPLRLLASRSLETTGSAQEWVELLTAFEKATYLSPRWRDIVLTAPVFSSQTGEIVPLLESTLLAENGKYLAQVLIALRTLATVPHPSRALLFTAEEIEKDAEIRAYWTAPLEPTWIPMLQLLLRLGLRIPGGALLATSEALSFWMGRTSPEAPLRREVALLARDLLFYEAGE